MTTNDIMAVERLRTLLHGVVDMFDSNSATAAAEYGLTVLPMAAFERTKNEDGVPMRRVVAYSEWETDPNPPERKAYGLSAFAARETPDCTKERLHQLWGQIYTSLSADLASDQQYIESLHSRLRAVIYDVVQQFGQGSPEHMRVLYALSEQTGTPPSQAALDAVASAEAENG